MTGRSPAAQAWQDLVIRREAQARRLQQPPPQDDYWGRRLDSRSTLLAPGDPDQDPLLARILDLVRPGDTVLDVGAGGGRYAIPLARSSARVIAVEPSPAMAAALRTNAGQYGVPVEVIEAAWQDVHPVPRADVVVCANVITPVAPIEAFLTSLIEATHRDLVLIVRVTQLDARTHLGELWQLIHGEPRIPEPDAAAALAILHELGATSARLEPFVPAWRPRWRDRASAERELATNLMLGPPPSAAHDLLGRYLDEHLIPAGDGMDLPAEHLVQGVITWTR